MKAYKLTKSNCKTKNNTLWGENITHEAMGDSTQDLCSDGWIHFYTDPNIAVLMNPKHANFSNPVLWECESHGEEKHESLKSGCRSLTTIKQLPLPIFTTNQKVAFGILCSLEVYKEPRYVRWANDWLNNTDRTHAAAAYVADAADAAVADAAYDAADAAYDTAAANANIDFSSLAKKALTYS